MTNFRNSLIQMMKLKNSENGKYANSEEFEIIKQEIVLADAKNLLIANGVNLSELESKSKEDNSKIIALALKLYAERTRATTTN